jgi:hypothetical protein
MARITRVGALLGLATMAAVAGSGGATPAPTGSNPHEHFVGWYRLPRVDRHTRKPLDGPGYVVPIFKRRGEFHTVCRWAEAPLKPTDDGLVWNVSPSSLKGSTFGFDEDAGEYFLIHRDLRRAGMDDWYVSGEKRSLTRIEKPTWVMDHAADPPEALDDFVGHFYFAWMPVLRLHVKRVDGGHAVAWQEFKPDDERRTPAAGESGGGDGSRGVTGAWRKPRDEPDAAIEPMREGLGLVLDQSKEKMVRLIYNAALRRYELVTDRKGEPGVIRLPLLRDDPLETTEDGRKVLPNLRIGIPAWRG